MSVSQLRSASAVALAMGILTSCAINEGADSESDAPPFIDPVVLSQNTCSGLKPSTPAVMTSPTELEVVDFEFGAPFILPGEVVGHFSYPISTSSDAAQVWFNTGLAHMANFNHDEAIAAFRMAQQFDADCAMCFWGEALAFGSNINAPFDPSRGIAGHMAARHAVEKIEGATESEIALVNAIAARYVAQSDGSMIEAAEAYADAMDDVARAHPSDKFILSLAAEANMNTQPWDYWDAGARSPKGRTERTVELLETALEIDPDFAPSIHLYIHATEASVDPFRAEQYADRLHAQSLGVGHLVHMPSHIYLRLGHWKKSHEANLAAIAADEEYISGSENADFYAQVYYPHNVHFVVSNAQLGGDGETALTVSEKLDEIAQVDPQGPAPFPEHVAAAPLFARLQFSEDAMVLATPEPAAPHAYTRTAWHYARGAVFARQGDLERAEAELSALAALPDEADVDLYTAYGLPILGVMDVARLTLEGRIHAARGDLTTAINRMDEAADLQEQLAYMEPTWWYYPTRQTLGGLLLLDGQTDRAEREFFRTLIKSPNNAYALFGLAETYKANGNARSEAHARYLFDEAWIGQSGDTPELSDL